VKDDDSNNPFDPEKLRYDYDPGHRCLTEPKRLKKRDEQFVLFPWTWIRRLKGATASTWMVAAHVLYEDWKENRRERPYADKPIKLPNGMLKVDGTSPSTKLRALRELERRGCITVEWKARKSPMVQRVL
jgi:hypothetical protein